jgi:hypothetical protein
MNEDQEGVVGSRWKPGQVNIKVTDGCLCRGWLAGGRWVVGALFYRGLVPHVHCLGVVWRCCTKYPPIASKQKNGLMVSHVFF